MEHAARELVAPARARLLPDYPELTAEVIVDYGIVDVCRAVRRRDTARRAGREGHDRRAHLAGFGDAVVATPAYLAARGHPETPDALIDHRYIGLRLPSSDTRYAWCFLHRGQETRVGTTGPVIFNTLEMMASCRS